MPENQRSCPGVRDEVLGGPRDMATAGLQESQSPEGVKFCTRRKDTRNRRRLLRRDGLVRVVFLRGAGAMPSEGIQGDEWGPKSR